VIYIQKHPKQTRRFYIIIFTLRINPYNIKQLIHSIPVAIGCHQLKCLLHCDSSFNRWSDRFPTNAVSHIVCVTGNSVRRLWTAES